VYLSICARSAHQVIQPIWIPNETLASTKPDVETHEPTARKAAFTQRGFFVFEEKN
jgi:hypothetical protein